MLLSFQLQAEPTILTWFRTSRVVETTRPRTESRISCALDDKYGLVIDVLEFADLSQVVVFFDRVIENHIANRFGRLMLMLVHDSFQIFSTLFITAVIDAIGIEENNVSSTHQYNLRHIGVGHVVFTEPDECVPASVRMISGDLEPERRKLSEAARSDIHEPAVFR